MHALKYWSLSITTGSFQIRLSICIGTLFISGGLYALFFSMTHNATIAVLPILPVLAGSWLFKYRGLLINVLSIGIIIYLINCLLFGASISSNSNLFGACIGSIFGLIVGSITCVLRQAFDMVVASRQQVIMAEHEKMLAYESKREAQDAKRRITLAYEHELQLESTNLFLAHVNHELCTPLVTVSGYLELLLTYHDQLNEDKQLHYMHKALEATQELNELITNLLNAAQFTAGKIVPSYENISLVQVTQEVLAKWNPRDLQDFTFSVEIPASIMAWADRRFLFHILRNLLSNACKYAPRQTWVGVGLLMHQVSCRKYVCP